MSRNYSFAKYKISSYDKFFDDLLMLEPETEAPNHDKMNTLSALDSFKKPMDGHHFTRDPSACWKKLFVKEVKCQAG